MYDILLFDIVAFSLKNDHERNLILEKLVNSIHIYFEKLNVQYDANDTGDGYYIALQYNKNSFSQLLLLICHLTDFFDEEVDFRFAITHDNINFLDGLGTKKLEGNGLIELNRILTHYKSPNIILLTQKIYDCYISQEVTKEKTIQHSNPKISIITYKKDFFKDKHYKEFPIYSVGIQKDDSVYGLEICDEDDSDDDIEHEDMKKILQYSFQSAHIEELSTPVIINTNKKNIIIYSFFKITHEFFNLNILFLSNKINKTQTINHFIESIKNLKKELIIIVNKKYTAEKNNDYWKNDLIRKFTNHPSKIISKNSISIKFYFLDDYISKNFLKTESTLKAANLVSEGFFINPTYTFNREQSIEKDLTKLLKKWLFDKNAPMMVVLGEGGIGKTSLLRHFVNILNNEDNNKLVLYIDANLLTSKFFKDINTLEIQASTVSTFLKSYYMDVLSENNNRFFMDDLKLIDLLISSGNLVIVIDGLDEIGSILKDAFDLTDFIKNIFEIQKLFGHTKIILSSRTPYWNKNINLSSIKTIKFDSIEIEGFSEEDVRNYFKVYFTQKLSKEIHKEILNLFDTAMNELKSSPFINNGFYWPYPVHIIADEIVNNKYNLFNRKIQSKYLPGTNNKNEFLIARMLYRDIERHKLKLELDDLLELFYEIIFNHNGYITEKDLQFFIEEMYPKTNLSLSILNHNPLLNESNERYKIVDFLFEYFIQIFLSYEIKQQNTSSHICHIISKYYDGESKLISSLSSSILFDDILEYIKKILENPSEKYFKKTINALLYILFNARNKIDINERTLMIKNIFQSDNGIQHLHIYGEFFSLNFESLRIYDSSFINYKNFCNSKFDENTHFIDSEIKLTDTCLFSKNQYLNNTIFDRTCTLSDTLKDYLRSSDNTSNHFMDITKDIKIITRNFFKNNIHRAQQLSDIKFTTNSILTFKNLLKELVDYNIIDDKMKKPPYNYIIHNNFLETIEQLLRNDYINAQLTKIIDELVEKYYK